MTKTESQKNYKSLFLISYFILLTYLAGCITPYKQGEPPELYHGQISLFLNGPVMASQDITFNLIAINIVSEDGISREITDIPRSLNSIALKGRQIFLGENLIPEGKYNRLDLIVREASIKRNGMTASLALSAEKIEFPVEMTVKKNQNTTVFLNWNADASITDEYLFKPVFTFKGRVPELGTLLVYVTNEGSDNVSAINRQTGEVVATVMVGKRPRGIAAGSARGHLKVYVANSGSDSISVIDPTTNRVENEIPIRFGTGPSGIAVASISSEKDLVFVTNYSSNTVSVVDTANYREIEKVVVGSGPVAVSADPSLESVLGTRFLKLEDINLLKSYREKFFNVYVANKNSNDISVLRMNILNNRCEEVINIGVEWGPVALSVDYPRGKIYVANHDSDKLSVIDILEIIKGNKSEAVSTINNVGNLIIDVIADPVFDRVYLLRNMPGEILIIRPFSDRSKVLYTAITPIIGTIPVGNSPRSLILDPEARKLYVVNAGLNNISVIDKTTRKEEQLITVGKKPYDIAVVQY